MEDFDNIIELDSFIRTAKEKGISIITGKYEVTFKLNGKKQDIEIVKMIVGKDIPANLNEYMKETEQKLKDAEKEENQLPLLSEQETWEKISPCFDLGKNGDFIMLQPPEWDDLLIERFNKGLKTVKASELTLSIKTFYNFYQKHKKFNPIIDRELMCSKLEPRLVTRRMEELKILSATLAYEPQERDYLKEWLIAFDVENLDDAYDLFRHWLWQVKRNACGLQTKNEIMLVLRSLTHGVGKSWSINYLTNPLNKFILHPGLNSITEERSIALDSSNNLVLNFDELAGAERTAIDGLKKWVTNPNISYRPMGTNMSQTVTKLASGIGTSNKPIAQYIKDPTGNRRFIELILRVKKRPEITNTDEFKENGIAWISIWKNIDENLENGYYLPEIKASHKVFASNCLSNGDVTSNMFEEIFVWSEQPCYNIRQQQLYNLYKEYCSINKLMAVSVQNFRIGLQTIIDSKKFNIHQTYSKNTYWYKIPPIWDYCYKDLNLSNEFKGLSEIPTLDSTKEETFKPLAKHTKQIDFT